MRSHREEVLFRVWLSTILDTHHASKAVMNNELHRSTSDIVKINSPDAVYLTRHYLHSEALTNTIKFDRWIGPLTVADEDVLPAFKPPPKQDYLFRLCLTSVINAPSTARTQTGVAGAPEKPSQSAEDREEDDSDDEQRLVVSESSEDEVDESDESADEAPQKGEKMKERGAERE